MFPKTQKSATTQAGGPYGGLWAGLCVSECLEENKQQTTSVVPGSIEMVELPQCGDSFFSLSFLMGG